jgi:hypothetical protein
MRTSLRNERNTHSTEDSCSTRRASVYLTLSTVILAVHILIHALVYTLVPILGEKLKVRPEGGMP